MRASTVSTKFPATILPRILAASLALMPIGVGYSNAAWAQNTSQSTPPGTAQSAPKTTTAPKPATAPSSAGPSSAGKGATTSGSAGATAGKPVAASSDAASSDAKKRYAAGETKFKAGDFAGALADFEAADVAKPSSQAARYIGLCQDNLQHYPEAVTAYERFLADVPPKMSAQGDEVRKRLEVIKAMPGKVHVESVPTAASITADGKPANNPTPTDIELTPGTHTLHVTSPGFIALDKEVNVSFGSKQDVQLTLEPEPAPPPVAPVAVAPPPVAPEPVPPPPQPRSKVPAFITGGLAVAAAGVGTVFGVMALSDKSDFDKNPSSSKADDGENHALIADMAFGVAITLGVTSAVLFLSHDEAPASASNEPVSKPKVAKNPVSFSAAPVVTPHGGGASAVVRF